MEKHVAEAADVAVKSGAVNWALALAGGVVLAILGMWNALLMFVIRQLNGRINKVEDGADDGVDKLRTEMLPRTECSILSGGTAEQIKKLTEAVETIHRRIDAFMHYTCEHCAKAVDKQETQGGP